MPSPRWVSPRRKPPPPPEQLSQYEAVRLFIDRAQAVKAGFSGRQRDGPGDCRDLLAVGRAATGD